MKSRLGPRLLVLMSACLAPTSTSMAEQVAVRHAEGRIHGFLALRDLDGNLLASGTSIQLANGNVVTNELGFRFKENRFRHRLSA